MLDFVFIWGLLYSKHLCGLVASREQAPSGVFLNEQNHLLVTFAEVIPTPGPNPAEGSGPGIEETRMVAMVRSGHDPAPEPADPEDLEGFEDPTHPTDPPGSEPSGNWWVLFLDWLIDGKLPTDQAEARRLARQAKSY